jgi:hypothetical protein
MPTYDETTLATRALQKLSITGSGQTPSAEDLAIVTDKIEGLLDDLTARRVLPSGEIDNIRPAAFDHLATLLAELCMSEFLVLGISAQKMEQQAQMAERKLRAIASDDAPFETLEANYF